jgi:hypothetical protein
MMRLVICISMRNVMPSALSAGAKIRYRHLVKLGGKRDRSDVINMFTRMLLSRNMTR